MSSSRRSSQHRPTAALLGVLVLLGAIVVPSGAAHAATVSSTLKRATGYSASQLQAKPVCGVPQPGRVRCLAQILTVKSSGRTASPVHLTQTAAAAGAPAAYTPAFLQWAYDTTWLSAHRGAGDTVAIVDAYGDSTAYSDMEAFRSADGLPSLATCSSSVTTSCFEVVNQNGQTSLPGNTGDEKANWNLEESLDIDAVSSLCPLCKILMVETNSDDYSGSPDLETGVSTAARLGANQISLSWATEDDPNAAQYSSPYTSITSAAILAASGDSDSTAPYIEYPAALSDVTAVGGTSLATDSGTARGVDESTWGCSDGLCGTGSGCDTSQARPAYQSGISTECSGRAYNDISADADPSTGLDIYDSQSGSEGCGTTTHWCIVGGTSMATPLVAAAEAVTGITTMTPAWTYTDASLLNDIVSGSNGSCPSGEYLICNAGTGWDGPTGNGSISGAVATGGPGVGADAAGGVNGNEVTFTGGVYPNGQSTTYEWQYWPSGNTASTTQTAPSTVGGQKLQSVSDTLCTLSPNTTYDYDLMANNASGPETGAQGSFTTSGSVAPTASAPPTISGSTEPGQTLTTQGATWNDQSCNSAPSYQWQESTSASGPWTTVGSSSSYALTSADLGRYVQVSATESHSSESTTVASAVVGPVSEPVTGTGTGSGTGTTTTTYTTTTTATTATTETVRFYRCAHTCRLIPTHGATTYRPRKVDYGKYIKVVTTLTRTANAIKAVRVNTRWVGPVTSSTAGAFSIGSSARPAAVAAVRGRTRKLLAQVRIAKRTKKAVTLVIKRKGRVATQAWAFVVHKGAVVSCTVAHSLRRPQTLKVALKAGQTLKLVAVQA